MAKRCTVPTSALVAALGEGQTWREIAFRAGYSSERNARRAAGERGLARVVRGDVVIVMAAKRGT